MGSAPTTRSAGPAADAAHSRFVQRIRRRYEHERPLLAPGVPDAAAMQSAVAALRERGRDLPAALRVMRQLVLERRAPRAVEQPDLVQLEGRDPAAGVDADRTDAHRLAERRADALLDLRSPLLDAGQNPPVQRQPRHNG